MSKGALEGKAAVITGAGSGIGKAIATLFAAEGAKVAVLDLNESAAQQVAQVCGGPGGRAFAVRTDVAKDADIAAAVAAAKRTFGHVDIAVSCAGIIKETPFLEMTEDEFQKVIDIDLVGTFRLARHAVPAMVEAGGGRIINIASQIAIKGAVKLCHYAAAKAGVIGLTKSLALELAQYHILVNAIAPGPLTTPFMSDVSDTWKQAKMRELPLGRFGEAREVAPTALLLASAPGGDLYTGQTLGPNSGDVMP